MGNLLYFLFKLKNNRLRRILLMLILKYDTPSMDLSRKVMKEFYGIEIGKYSYGCFHQNVAKGTRIGSFCSIASGVRFGGMNHPLTFISTNPFLYLKSRGFVPIDDLNIMEQGNMPIILEDDVWVGTNAIILPGIHVGKGAVIGAGAVVTKNVPPYSIVVGVPAKVLRYRFNQATINKLLKVDWGNWEDEKIRENLDCFYNHEIFISKNN